ncbi:MAG: hypothetical protein PHQ65_10995 [Bacteroidales bacterium]|nr:hypothetical protein [Bacteroidales bacterium]MDD3665781.1 hypothetical protein [Bacteroidales bacterium]
MEKSKFTKVLAVVILLLVGIQLVVTLLTRGEANEAIRQLKEAHNQISVAQQQLAAVNDSLTKLAVDLTAARSDLNTLNHKMANFDGEMFNKVLKISSQLNLTLKEVRDDNSAIRALQSKLSKLQPNE